MDITEFLKSDEIQKLLEEENLEEIYSICDVKHRNELSDFLLNIGVNPFKYFKRIPENAFHECDSLVNVVIPEGVTSIRESAFSYCPNIKTVTLPKNLYIIDDLAFYKCSNLIEIKMDDGLKEICYGAFSGCTNLKYITIPDSVTKIGFAAFENCTGAENIIIGKNVRYIDDYAFSNCTVDFVTYNNTKHEWDRVCRFTTWRNKSTIKEVRCTDGVITYDD